MFEKKKSFSNEVKGAFIQNLFATARHGGNNNGESDCCNGTQSGSCRDNGNPQCCN